MSTTSKRFFMFNKIPLPLFSKPNEYGKISLEKIKTVPIKYSYDKNHFTVIYMDIHKNFTAKTTCFYFYDCIFILKVDRQKRYMSIHHIFYKITYIGKFIF